MKVVTTEPLVVKVDLPYPDQTTCKAVAVSLAATVTRRRPLAAQLAAPRGKQVKGFAGGLDSSNCHLLFHRENNTKSIAISTANIQRRLRPSRGLMVDIRTVAAFQFSNYYNPTANMWFAMIPARCLKHMDSKTTGGLTPSISAVVQEATELQPGRGRQHTVHLSVDHCKSLFSLWIEASHNKAQHEGVWMIKQAKQLS